MNNSLIISEKTLSDKSVEETSAIARQYFLSNKYIEQLGSAKDQVKYSKKKHGLGFNPLDWANEVSIQLIPNVNQTIGVSILVTIDTTGQTVFAGEHQKWHDFINNFIKTLHGERLSDLALAQRTANSEVLRFFLRLLPYAIVLGLILGLIKAGVVHALFGK